MERRQKKVVKFVWVRVQGASENLTRQNNPFLVALLELLFVLVLNKKRREGQWRMEWKQRARAGKGELEIEWE